MSGIDPDFRENLSPWRWVISGPPSNGDVINGRAESCKKEVAPRRRTDPETVAGPGPLTFRIKPVGGGQHGPDVSNHTDSKCLREHPGPLSC